jgi:hypothetical protein
MGLMKEEQEKAWIESTNRTIYQCYRAYEKGAEKWSREQISRKGKADISEEGQELLEDKDKWRDKTYLFKECYESRKRQRINADGAFMPHQKGQSRQRTQQTGCSGRGREESGWETG